MPFGTLPDAFTCLAPWLTGLVGTLIAPGESVGRVKRPSDGNRWDSSPHRQRFPRGLVEWSVRGKDQGGRTHTVRGGVGAGRRNPLVRQCACSARQPVTGRDDAGVGRRQMLPRAVHDGTHTLLQG